MYRRGSVGSGYSGGDVFPGIDRYREGGPEGGGIFDGLLRELQFFHSLRCERKTNQAPAVLGHEINGVRA